MKKTLLPLLVFCFITMFCKGQVNVLFHTGTGTYWMKEQKELQEDFRNNSELPWQPVHKFPPYWTFGGSLSFQVLPKFRAGGWMEYGSTGGTLHYADYSGSARLDQLLHYTQFGGFLSLQINKSESWPIFFTSHLSVAKTKESLSYEIIVDTSKDEDSQLFESTSFGFRPGLMTEHKIKVWVFQAGVGMELQIPGVLNSKDGYALTNSEGENVRAQWTGIRAQLGVGFQLNRKRIKKSVQTGSSN